MEKKKKIVSFNTPRCVENESYSYFIVNGRTRLLKYIRYISSLYQLYSNNCLN